MERRTTNRSLQRQWQRSGLRSITWFVAGRPHEQNTSEQLFQTLHIRKCQVEKVSTTKPGQPRNISKIPNCKGFTNRCNNSSSVAAMCTTKLPGSVWVDLASYQNAGTLATMGDADAEQLLIASATGVSCEIWQGHESNVEDCTWSWPSNKHVRRCLTVHRRPLPCGGLSARGMSSTQRVPRMRYKFKKTTSAL